MSKASPRAVVRDYGFEQSSAQLFTLWEDAEAYITAAENFVARFPEAGFRNEDGTWLLMMPPVKGMTVILSYHFYDQVVVLHTFYVLLD